MSRRLVLGLVAALAGCVGEQVSSPPADGGTDAGGEAGSDGASDAAGDSATCSAAPGNLVRNASFEDAPGGVLPGWSHDPVESLVQRRGGAAHCGAWAEVKLSAASTSTPAFFGQEILLDAPLKKGTTVLASAYVRALDAVATIELGVGIVGGPSAAKLAPLPSDGSWKKIDFDWVLPEDATKVYVAVVSTSSARTLGVDHVTLVAVP